MFEYQNLNNLATQERIELLDKALNQLNGITQARQLICESANHEAFVYIAAYCWNMGNSNEELASFSTKCAQSVFIKTLNHLYENQSYLELDRYAVVSLDGPQNEISNNAKYSQVLICILYSMNSILKKSTVKYIHF